MGEAFIVATPKVAGLRALNYTPEVEQLRRARKPMRLGDLVARVGGSFGAVFTRIDCDKRHGVPLYSQVDTFAAEPEGRIIRRDAMPRPNEQAVLKWQILLAAAGQMGEGNLFGRSILADDRLTNGYLGPDTLSLAFPEPGSDLSLWVYAFLNTGLGLRAVRACAYGTSIPRLRPDLVEDLPLPTADSPTLKRVGFLIRYCVEQRQTYVRELQAARRVVEDLPEMLEAYKACSERQPRALLWGDKLATLSAWTYASTGSALEMLKRRWSGRLSDVLTTDGVFNGPRFSRIPCDPPHGVDFMSQRDAFLIRPKPRRIVHPGFDDRLLFAPERTIMVGAQGTLGEGEIFGRAMLVQGRFSRSAFTQHLLRVIPTPEHTSLVYAFMTTLVGMRLLRSTAVGTKLLSMRLDLLRQLPIPDVTTAQRRLIERHVEASLRARESAEQAETEAVRIVEEEVLPTWLA